MHTYDLPFALQCKHDVVKIRSLTCIRWKTCNGHSSWELKKNIQYTDVYVIIRRVLIERITQTLQPDNINSTLILQLWRLVSQAQESSQDFVTPTTQKLAPWHKSTPFSGTSFSYHIMSGMKISGADNNHGWKRHDEFAELATIIIASTVAKGKLKRNNS